MQPVVQLKTVSNPAVDLGRSLKLLTKKDVLVGVPESTAPRKRDGKQRMNNATIAYIQDQGSPLAHIPPREFLRPGVKNAKDDIAKFFGQAGKAAMEGKPQDVEKALNAAGLTAQKSIRRKIQTGPFTPLKAATIRARSRRHKGRSSATVTPLIDTGQMLASINYVIREK